MKAYPYVNKELQQCPFCKSEARENNGKASCSDMECWLRNVWIPIDEWNKRPIEDAMQAKLDEAEDGVKHTIQALIVPLRVMPNKDAMAIDILQELLKKLEAE